MLNKELTLVVLFFSSSLRSMPFVLPTFLSKTASKTTFPYSPSTFFFLRFKQNLFSQSSLKDIPLLGHRTRSTDTLLPILYCHIVLGWKDKPTCNFSVTVDVYTHWFNIEEVWNHLWFVWVQCAWVELFHLLLHWAVVLSVLCAAALQFEVLLKFPVSLGEPVEAGCGRSVIPPIAGWNFFPLGRSMYVSIYLYHENGYYLAGVNILYIADKFYML